MAIYTKGSLYYTKVLLIQSALPSFQLHSINFGIIKSWIGIKEIRLILKTSTFVSIMEYEGRTIEDDNNGIIIRYLTEKKFRCLRHGIFLLGLFLLFINSNMHVEFPTPYKTYFSFAIWAVFVCMFYVNMYVLIPRYFFRGKYEMYILLLVLLVSTSLMVASQIANCIHLLHAPSYKKVTPQTMSFVNGILICIPIILTTTTLKLFNRWILDNKRISELKNLAFTTELASLKNQIQPHFLFNMLNNVKALIRKNPEMATEVILKLSDFLRYQLYENDNDKTLLQSEINFISNFLKLEEIRRDHLVTRLYCEPELAKKNIFLPPHLFTAFIENAIKHSLCATENKVYIHISFTTTEQQLCFECKNSKDPNLADTKSKYGGLGLTNAKRRLELLYPNNYYLDIVNTDTEYLVKLNIPL